MTNNLTKAAGILFISQGRVLLLKRSGEGDHPREWALPGGKLEPGEDPDQAARREVFEETGYSVSDPLTGYVPGKYMVFIKSLPEIFIPVLNDEHTEYQWCHLWDLPKPVHPKLLPLLESFS